MLDHGLNQARKKIVNKLVIQEYSIRQLKNDYVVNQVVKKRKEHKGKHFYAPVALCDSSAFLNVLVVFTE